MLTESRLVYRIAIVMAFIIFISSVVLVNAEEKSDTVVVNNATDNSRNITVDTSPAETVLLTNNSEPGTITSPIETLVETITTIISPVPTQTIEKTVIEEPTVQPKITLTETAQSGTLEVLETESSESSATPEIAVTALAPSAQRKISTNLLYIIDSNTPEKDITREQAANIMKASGQIKTEQPKAAASKQGAKIKTGQPASNEIFVYVDLVPTASTSVADSYFQEVTDRSEEEHYIAGWVDVSAVEQIASLADVSNVRPGEPAITKDSPVYQDTKFVNKRAGLSPATAEEAKASVRAFENAPSMALEQKRTMKTPRGDVYEMASDSGRYYVDAETGEVELASFYEKQKQSSLVSTLVNTAGITETSDSDPVTKDQAVTIAQDYAGTNYKNFYRRTMVLKESKFVDHGAGGKTYYNTWMENVNGVTVPNGVVVTVDADTGKVLSYIGIDQPVSADIVPSVSRDAAIDLAISAFPSIVPVKSDANLKVISPDEVVQKLVWSVDIVGAPRDFIQQGGQVLIDAHTGEILMVNSLS